MEVDLMNSLLVYLWVVRAKVDFHNLLVLYLGGRAIRKGDRNTSRFSLCPSTAGVLLLVSLGFARIAWPWELGSNASYRSQSGEYEIKMQSDGNLVLRQLGTSPRLLWSSWTISSGATAVFQSDGNLVIKSQSGEPIWSTRTYGLSGAQIVLKNDGNLEIISADAVIVWSTKTSSAYISGDWQYRGAGLLANTALRSGEFLKSSLADVMVVMEPNGNLVAYGGEDGRAQVWSSNTFSAGSRAFLSAEGKLQILSANGETIWSSPGFQNLSNNSPHLDAFDEFPFIAIRRNFSQIMWAPLLGPNFLPNPSIALGTDQISGWVSEITEDGTVHGWATDLKDPNTALDLKLIIDGNRFAEQRKIARSVNYQKLYEWGIITKSQFMLSIPDTYLDGRRHRIQIEATSTLSNSSIILGSSSDANEFQLRNRALTSRLAGTECLSPVSRCASSNYDFGAPNFTEDTGFADSKNYFSLWNCQSTNGVNVIRKLNIMSLGKRDLRTQPDSLYSTEIHPLTKSPIIYFNTARLNKSDRNQWSIKKALFEGERWKIYDVFDLPSHRYGVSSPDGKFPNGFLFQDYNQPGWAPSSAFQRRDTSIPGVSKFPANSEHTSFPLEGWGPLGITAIRNYIQPPPYVDGGPTGRTCLHMNPKLFEYDNNTPTKLAVFIFRVSPTQDSNCVLPTGENLVPGYYVYQYDPKLGWQFLPGQTAPITSHQAIKLAGDRQETGKPLFLAGGWEGDIESITYGREGVVRTRLISCPGVHFGEATGSTKNLVTLAIDPTSPLVTHPTAAEPVFSFDIFYGYQQSPSQVIQVTPERGNNLGGVRVTLVGVDFVAGSKIFIGTSECGSPTWVSSRTMTCVVPALAAGFHTVKVVNPDGLASASLVRYEAVASRWEPVLNYSRPFGIEFCKKVCGNRSLTSVPSPEGARCASGEVIPRSSHPRVAFRHGCKPNRRCLPQGIVRGAINNYQYCYGPGQRRNNELTDVTMGCYCGL